MDNSIYQKFKEASNKQLVELKPSDIVLFESDEIPENYTLVAPATEEVLQIIKGIVQKCPNYVRDQYWYPETNVHLTILGNIAISTDPDMIINSMKIALQDARISFRMIGVASNMHAVSISCYPQDFDIYALRQQVRSEIHNLNDDYTVYLQEYEHMGWVNFMRYLRQPTESELDEFRQLMHEEFGIFKPTIIQLYKNRSKTLNRNKRELVAEIALH